MVVNARRAPAVVPQASDGLTHAILTATQEVGITRIIPILLIRKLRRQGVKSLPRGTEAESGHLDPPCPESLSHATSHLPCMLSGLHRASPWHTAGIL